MTPATIRRSENPTDRSPFPSWTPVLVIVLAVLAVHLPSLVLPYYFIDDVWLYRPSEPGFPSVWDTVMVLQGRPVFGVLALAMQDLRLRFGIEAILLARLVAVVFVAIVAHCVYLLFRRFQTPLVALGFTVLLVTLPSFQMYVSAAPLFAPSLALCGFAALAFGRFALSEEIPKPIVVIDAEL